MKLHTHTAAIAGLLITTSLLSACQKNDTATNTAIETTVGQKVDGAIASTERAASAAKAEIKEVAKEAQTAASGATGNMTTSTRDGIITTKVNAELVKDPSLSALKINVDTTDGHVVLNGNAPSDTSRARAATLARAVEGVKDVDNRLGVEVKK